MRRKAKKSSRNTLADMYARAYCKRERKCLHCGTNQTLEWCHLVGRRVRRLRWHPLNAVCMCHTCHRDFTDSPAAFNAWIEEMFPGRWQALAELERTMEKGNPDDWIEYYKKLGVSPTGR